MGTIASQITSITIVYSIVYSNADQRKHQSSASLDFVRWIHRGPVNSRTNGQLRGKCFHLMTSSCAIRSSALVISAIKDKCGSWEMIYTSRTISVLGVTVSFIFILLNSKVTLCLKQYQSLLTAREIPVSVNGWHFWHQGEYSSLENKTTKIMGGI